MNPGDFSRDALVLFAHGSSQDPAAGAPVYQHAAELRRRRCFAEVREAFWKQEPRLTDVLSGVQVARVFLVPLFISDGYFSQQVIPRELGFAAAAAQPGARFRQVANQTLVYCQPVGTHEHMTGVVLERAREVVERFPFPHAAPPQQTTLFVAGHGTEQNDNSREAIVRQAEAIRRMNLYAATHAVFLEEEPRIGSCYQLAQTRNLVVVPFFIGEGPHVEMDIPRILGEPERQIQERLRKGQPSWRNPTEKKGKMVWYAASAGTAPQVADVIVDRVREAAASMPAS